MSISFDIDDIEELNEFLKNYNPSEQKNLMFPSMFSTDALIHDLNEYGYNIRIVKKSEEEVGIDYDFLVYFKKLFLTSGLSPVGQRDVDWLYEKLTEVQKEMINS